MTSTARIRVPGSTSNIGPGYDCLGIALDLHNTILVETTDGALAHPEPPHEMVAQTADLFFRASGHPLRGFRWSIEGDVPISRGLGSSVTLRLGILMGLNELFGRPLDREALYQLCADLEGHPDNAGPAAFGGFFVASAAGARLSVPVDPALRFALVIPDFEVLTDDARRVLPATVPHRDATLNVGNAAVISAAFASRAYETMRGCFGDTLHQPHRRHLVPGLEAAIEAGTKAGALGGFLSGSGSTVACVCWGDQVDPDVVAAAMRESHPRFAGARTMTVSADNAGAVVLDPSTSFEPGAGYKNSAASRTER